MSETADNATQMASELHNITNKHNSAEKWRRELKNVGMKAVIKQKESLLGKKYRRARSEWAQSHQYWTMGDCKRAVWSYYSKVNAWAQMADSEYEKKK